MNLSGKYLLPVTAILAGLVAAWVTRSSPNAPTTAEVHAATIAPSAAAMSANGVHGQSAPEAEGERISGTVLETIGVPNYTYLRIGNPTANQRRIDGEIWAAVSAAELKVGQMVTIVGAQRMDKFASATLKRTFDVIYFGAMEEASGTPSAGALPPGHPDIAGRGDPSGALPPQHPAIGADANARGSSNVDPSEQRPMGASESNPHGSPTAGGDQVPVGKVERAKGKLGHTVSELVNGRQGLAGSTVRVRGVVVKVTTGVLGKTFLHLRDGSGSEQKADHDITVTTEEVPKVGSQVTFEGSVVLDKDFGAGYSYRILLENAHTVGE